MSITSEPQPDDHALARLVASQVALPAVVELLYRADSVARDRHWWQAALPLVARAISAARVAVARLEEGQWVRVAGDPIELPADLLSESLDAERPLASGGHLVAPLAFNMPWALAASGVAPAAADPQGVLAAFDALAAACGVGRQSIAGRAAHQRRIERLETILRITHEWNQTHEMEALLMQMAQAATELFACDRASIFLWDKGNRTLVGRPALGVENGEIRIADDSGVVGHVVQTGEARRVDRRRDQEAIDRHVDQQLGYRTETLLCVPLHAADGDRVGAFELINKLEGNFTADDEAGLAELAGHAATALANTRDLQRLAAAHRQMIESAAGGVRLIGDSPAIEALRSTISRVADTELAVLILGENGTGKEVAAQSIHYQSGRRAKPCIAVNCAAIPENLLESELFGHEKGAFTDAHEARPGKFELAADGTIFLDEIGDMSLGGQSKLLRVLEEKIVVRVGGSQTIHTDARVIAATNQNLAAMVREKRFREDLYFRLNVVTIELPPLRDRGDDIGLLAEHFLHDFSRKANRKPPRFTALARKKLRAHAWPGNVRELRNLMERLAYLTQGEKIDGDDLAFILDPHGESSTIVPDNLPLAEATHEFQQYYIRRSIQRAGGNMTDAAERLGLHRSNLYRKMRQLDMETNEE